MPHPSNTRRGSMDGKSISGRYSYVPEGDPSLDPGTEADPSIQVIVRLDVDGPQAQNCLSVSVTRRFPPARAHGIAEVTGDSRPRKSGRRVQAELAYIEGDRQLLPGNLPVFEVLGAGDNDSLRYSLTFADREGLGSYPLVFESPFFDDIEFEVDRVENASPAVTSYNTGAHPNRPTDLPEESLSLARVYERAGFGVSISEQASAIPLVEAGADGAWSNGELHNAMVTYWSRFAHRPQWALWVLYAARHELGESLGGVMFDDIGDNHRQGTAIFTDSFVSVPPPEDPAPEAWVDRMVFCTAVHEIGHAFNLAHSWQKGLVIPLGDPWMPLRDQPEVRSFMNYPFNVTGGESAFFSDFQFRFSADELLFMRHSPRGFVQMGNSDWFENHGFEAPDALAGNDQWQLRIRANRDLNIFAFLEPVMMEFKLTNKDSRIRQLDRHTLSGATGVTVYAQREGRTARIWRPMITRCQLPEPVPLQHGESLYEAHNVSASAAGWLIDEPGFYKIQASVDVGGRQVVSNVLRIYVTPPRNAAENRLAPDYFTEDVARALVFHGVPALPKAMAVLEAVAARCPRNPAALHAILAISAPDLRDYKLLDTTGNESRLVLRCHRARVDRCAPLQTTALLKAAHKAADTLGHITYFHAIQEFGEALYREGDPQEARRVARSALQVMKKRSILDSVIHSAEDRLNRMT